VSTPQFIPRRERDAARRQSNDSGRGRRVDRDVAREHIPPYLAVDYPDASDGPAARFGLGLAADLVALSTLVAMRAPLDRS